MSPEQADEMITLLRGISAKLGVKLKPKAMSEAELKGWADLGKSLTAIRVPAPGPDASGLPPSGGHVDPESFFRRKDSV